MQQVSNVHDVYCAGRTEAVVSAAAAAPRTHPFDLYRCTHTRPGLASMTKECNTLSAHRDEEDAAAAAAGDVNTLCDVAAANE